MKIRNYIRHTFGYSAEYDGNRLFERGAVTGPDMLSDHIFMYHITDSEQSGNVLIWEKEPGVPLHVVCDNHRGGDRNCVAALLAHDDRRVGMSSDVDIYKSARDLPVSISEHRMFDLRYELERWHGEDNHEAFEEITEEFIDRVLNGPFPSNVKVDCLDLAYDVCMSYRGFNASYAATIISDSRHRITDMLSHMGSDQLIQIITNMDRRHSRKWLLGDREGIGEHVAVRAYMKLAMTDPLFEYDCDIQCLLADIIGDPKRLVSMFTVEQEYYEYERIVKREFGRGHVSVSRALANIVPQTLVKGHELEYARLRREVGLRDDRDYFVEAFYQEPNGKRLIDVLDSHPMIDREELLHNAWERAPRDINTLIFFCRNGFSEQVLAHIRGTSADVIKGWVSDDPDSVLLLSEVLVDLGEYDQSSRLCILCLDDATVTVAFDVDSVIRMMRLLDSIYDCCGQEDISYYMQEFRYRVRKRALWKAYSEHENGHF